MAATPDNGFEKRIGGLWYVFKRMYHPDLPLTYHVHTESGHRHRVFRIRRVGDEWKFLWFRQVPADAILHKHELTGAIAEQERIRANTSEN